MGRISLQTPNKAAISAHIDYDCKLNIPAQNGGAMDRLDRESLTLPRKNKRPHMRLHKTIQKSRGLWRIEWPEILHQKVL